MIYKNSKLSLLVFSLILIMLLATTSFAIYDIKEKNKEISALSNEADRVTEARSLVQSIKVAQKSAATELEDFNNLVLSRDKLVFLIEDIEKMGRALGLDTNIVSVGKLEDTKSKKSDVIRIVIETQGSWAPTLSFLRAIESLPHRVMIEETSLSKVETNWNLKITLTLYLFD